MHQSSKLNDAGSIPAGNAIFPIGILGTAKKGKYVYAICPSHPRRTKNNYVLLHRVLMENKLGRFLLTNEEVHHRDENGKNNSLDNLTVMSRSEHRRLHSTKGRTMVTLTCPSCEKVFTRERKNTYLSKGGLQTFCSRSCNGTYQKRYLGRHS